MRDHRIILYAAGIGAGIAIAGIIHNANANGDIRPAQGEYPVPSYGVLMAVSQGSPIIAIYDTIVDCRKAAALASTVWCAEVPMVGHGRTALTIAGDRQSW